MNTYRFLLIALVALLANGCATHLLTSGRVVMKDDKYVIDVSFNDHDRRLIHQYYRHHKKRKRKNIPPGLAKRGLPPGLAKRDTLPPGLEGHALPANLEAQLTSLPNTYVRVQIGADLVLLDRNTRMVLDVIYGVAS